MNQQRDGITTITTDSTPFKRQRGIALGRNVKDEIKERYYGGKNKTGMLRKANFIEPTSHISYKHITHMHLTFFSD
jgi:hypothetical protein